MDEQNEPKVISPDEGQSASTVGLAAISERAAFENWFNTECSLPDINTIYGTVAWAAWKSRAKVANDQGNSAAEGRPVSGANEG